MPGTQLRSKSGLSDRYAGRESGAYMRRMPASSIAALHLLVHVVPGLEDVAADEIAQATSTSGVAQVDARARVRDEADAGHRQIVHTARAVDS